MTLTDENLRDCFRSASSHSKGSVPLAICFQSAFGVRKFFPFEELFSLNTRRAPPIGPNENLGNRPFIHTCRLSVAGFNIGVLMGFKPLGSLGRSAPDFPMLPDTVHKLPREERFAYARLLAYMARIDNELTIDEMAMFEQRLGTALLSPDQRELIRDALRNPPTLEDCLAELSGEAGRLALRDAVMMAAADGNVDEDERDALEDISEHLGLREDAVDQLLQWTVKGYQWMKEGYDILDNLEE